MIENKIKLNIISNRKLCANENLEKQIEKTFSAYQRKIILEKMLFQPAIMPICCNKNTLIQKFLFLAQD